MSTSKLEGRCQLNSCLFRFSGCLYRPSSYFNRLESSSNVQLGLLIDMSGRSPHTLNLVGQMIIFGFDNDAFDNEQDEHKTEVAYLQE
jgi:hypothetical protein